VLVRASLWRELGGFLEGVRVAEDVDFCWRVEQAGWQIEGQQIRRTALPSLDSIHGLAVVVRDKAAPPPPAVRLKAALNAAHISAALVADATLAPDSTLLWVGRRPGSVPIAPPK